MKLFHISDLHIGKRLNDFPLVEDQVYILNQILCAAELEKPDALLIAGDVYDKTVPPAEAVLAFDDFVYALHAMGIAIFAISGNHDSPERLSFGARMMHQSGVHIARVYDGEISSVRLEDAHGAVEVFMLPFIKPSHVRRFFEDESIETYTDAVRAALSRAALQPEARNVLLAHQFVTGAQTSESEEVNVGGLDNVDATVFEGFDYVALGHLHSPQNIGRETIRYCGTPLKYSFSEMNQTKSITVVEMLAKGQTMVSTIPLSPMRELRAIKGSYMEITENAFYHSTTLPEDYLHITLTDEHDVPEAMGKLRTIYRNLMKLSYDNTRTQTDAALHTQSAAVQRTPLEIFAAFYETQNGQPMTAEQASLMQNLAESLQNLEGAR